MSFQELKQIALKNPKGKIVARDAAGNDVNNSGAWMGTDCNRDIPYDLLIASLKLSSIPSHLVGNTMTLGVLLETYNSELFTQWFYLAPLFKEGGNLWEGPKFIRYDVTADPGIVLLVGTEGDVVYIDTR